MVVDVRVGYVCPHARWAPKSHACTVHFTAGWFTAFFVLRRPESAYIVLRMSLLFAMDSFAGAFVQQVRMRVCTRV
jgi:hypothetical protein